MGFGSFSFTQIAPKIDFEFVVVSSGTFTMRSVDKGSLISEEEAKEKKLDFEWWGCN